MLNFDFYNPTRIVFGKDRLNELDKLVPAHANILVLYGGGSVKKFGALDNVKEALGTRKVFEFGGIEPNPAYETLEKAIELVRKENIDFLLAVGGGSVIDGTKFVAAAVHLENNYESCSVWCRVNDTSNASRSRADFNNKHYT